MGTRKQLNSEKFTMTKYDTTDLSLGDAQKLLPLMIRDLITFAYKKGYTLTFGDAYRSPKVFGSFGKKKEGSYGRSYSNHKRRLAVDFNLFKDGVYLKQTEEYTLLGEYWESLGGSWGGRFNDGNHFSIKYKGVR